MALLTVSSTKTDAINMGSNLRIKWLVLSVMHKRSKKTPSNSRPLLGIKYEKNLKVLLMGLERGRNPNYVF